MAPTATVEGYKERSPDTVAFNDYMDEVTQKLDEAEAALISGVAPLDAVAVFQRLRATGASTNDSLEHV